MGAEITDFFISRDFLITDYNKSLMLDFKSSPPSKKITSSEIPIMALSAVVNLAALPLFCLLGTLFLSISSFRYLKSAWNQRKIVTVLANEDNLREFAAKRVECCEKQIENLEADAMYLLERDLKNPDELNLSIPSKKTFMDRFRPLPNECWNDFSWDAFLHTDFIEKSNVPRTPDKRCLLELEGIRTKINLLKGQKDLFSHGNIKLEEIQAVAQMSFVKNALRRQRSKEWLIHSVRWFFPLGIMADIYLSRSHSDRLTYENNKSFLPSGVGLDSHKDLIEAHNELLAANPFLVPYIVNNRTIYRQ